jgi:hypothetical protein
LFSVGLHCVSVVDSNQTRVPPHRIERLFLYEGQKVQKEGRNTVQKRRIKKRGNNNESIREKVRRKEVNKKEIFILKYIRKIQHSLNSVQ